MIEIPISPFWLIASLFALCAIGFFFEARCERHQNEEAAKAIDVLLKMSKEKGRLGKAARDALTCWLSVPPHIG